MFNLKVHLLNNQRKCRYFFSLRTFFQVREILILELQVNVVLNLSAYNNLKNVIWNWAIFYMRSGQSFNSSAIYVFKKWVVTCCCSVDLESINMAKAEFSSRWKGAEVRLAEDRTSINTAYDQDCRKTADRRTTTQSLQPLGSDKLQSEKASTNA